MLRAGVQLARHMATTSNAARPLIAVCQMTSDNDLSVNLKTAGDMIRRAGERNCKMVFLPECFDFIGRTKEEQVELAMSAEGDFIGEFRSLAKQHDVWLSLGGFHHQDPSHPLPYNTHLIIDNEGNTRAQYNKLHLFDLEIPGKLRLLESEFSKHGTEMVSPVATPIGNVATSICYDLRFPELSLWNRKKGAHVLTYPAAFTLNTGLAHWETLLRARAIETQCYVVAAAQTGVHNPKRQSYGHAMVVDPWGAVVAQCSERVDMCFAEVDVSYVDELRAMQPVFRHRRSDLYTLHVNENNQPSDQLFSSFPIRADSIFHQSAHSYAFVNLKPVVDGHVLVAPIQPVKRLTDLTDEQTADLFITAKKVQSMLEKFHGVTASTVCVQDGKDAGQTVEHVHVHVLARRAGDFGESTDNVYKELADHDKDAARKPRSAEEMAAEAKLYNQAMHK